MEMSDDADFEPVRLDRPGGSSRMPSAPSEFEPIEDVPLSQRTQPRIPGIGAAPPSEPGAGQRGWRPPGSRPPPLPPSEPPIRREPPIGMPERPQRPAPEAAFDTIWPPERRADKTEPQPDAESAPPAAARPNGDATHRTEPPKADKIPVSILKSGVVDGMAYTLYTDGSIEAELAQGVVRFGSIEELRNHLEKGA